jgi:hypothetical protein
VVAGVAAQAAPEHATRIAATAENLMTFPFINLY